MVVGETRFLRSDSLACLCSALASMAPTGARQVRRDIGVGTEVHSRSTDGENGTAGGVAAAASEPPLLDPYLLEMNANARECVSALCIDLLCEIALKNRDRLSVSWPSLCGLLMRTIEGSASSSPLLVSDFMWRALEFSFPSARLVPQAAAVGQTSCAPP